MCLLDANGAVDIHSDCNAKFLQKENEIDDFRLDRSIFNDGCAFCAYCSKNGIFGSSDGRKRKCDDSTFHSFVCACKIGAFFSHFAELDGSTEFFERSNVKINGTFTDLASAGSGDDDVFVCTSEKCSDHEDRDAV